MAGVIHMKILISPLQKFQRTHWERLILLRIAAPNVVLPGEKRISCARAKLDPWQPQPVRAIWQFPFSLETRVVLR